MERNSSLKVTVVTLSYNVPDKLVRMVETLVNQPEIDQFILIENHSSVDMEVAYSKIRDICATSDIELIFHRPETPFNFSEGQNYGIDCAKNDLVFLMNNDAYFAVPDSLKTSIGLLSGSVKMVGHKILNLDGSVNHFGIFVDFSKAGFHLASGFSEDDPIFDVPISVPAVTGAAVLLLKSDLRFDPRYWFEREDVDFCLQHIQRGFEIVCNPLCVIVHEESSTRGKKQAASTDWIRKQHKGAQLFRNRWRWFILAQVAYLPRFWRYFDRRIQMHYKQVLVDIVVILTMLPLAIWIFSGIVPLGIVLIKILAIVLIALAIKAAIFSLI